LLFDLLNFSILISFLRVLNFPCYKSIRFKFLSLLWYSCAIHSILPIQRFSWWDKNDRGRLTTKWVNVDDHHLFIVHIIIKNESVKQDSFLIDRKEKLTYLKNQRKIKYSSDHIESKY
jgi:hypothetical protein